MQIQCLAFSRLAECLAQMPLPDDLLCDIKNVVCVDYWGQRRTLGEVLEDFGSGAEGSEPV